MRRQTQRLRCYYEARDEGSPLDIKGRTVILVDGGVATGATMLMAVEVIRNQGAASVVVAVPVAPPPTPQAEQYQECIQR